ncbi:conserved hypothetical protein [Sporisorium reilianum SRZ2]|uniref:CCHC-type domain-containing protein n=1 Tax=Sporisorium reilianum (strain SRZ2) TaxID=999809 RepID=E7A0B3_SPORE|nr:conserved hypothetical protein [Sporisorium reilianum SRZ2]
MPEKILLIGPVNGRLLDLISKVSAIQSKHGPFTALFILGDLFHPSPTETLLAQQTDLLQGTIHLPIPTYFYQGSAPPTQAVAEAIAAASNAPQKDVPQGLVPVAENLFWAKGKSGVFVTQNGFRVAFVGGVWDSRKFAAHVEGEAPFDADTWYESELQRTQDEQEAHITPATVHRLLAHTSFRLPSPSSSTSTSTQGSSNGTVKPGTLAAARASASASQAREAAQTAALQTLTSRAPIDLLLTNCWPTGITLFSPVSPADPLGGLPDPTARTWGSPAIARLAAHACPRYHFALAPSSSAPDLPVGIAADTLDMGAFWERAPYTTDLAAHLAHQPQLAATPAGRRQAERLKTVTRFVSLARFGNERKRRWFLALNLSPADGQEAAAVPANATQTPYFVPGAAGGANAKRPVGAGSGGDVDAGPNFRFQEPRKRQKAEAGADVPPPGYVCRICNVEGHYIRSCPSKAPPPSTAGEEAAKPQMPLPAGLPAKPVAQHRTQMIPVGPANCWFCLSNPAVAKSLIVSIAAESYLVFPKGAFVHPSISRVPADAAHLLVVPLSHTSNLLPPAHPVLDRAGEEEGAEEKARTRAEMGATKASVRAVWAASGHAMLEWTLVRVRTSSRMTHLQTQLLALLHTAVAAHNVVQTLDDALSALPTANATLRTPSDIGAFFAQTQHDGDGDADGYFHLALHDQAGEKEWLVPLTTADRFPVQLVRSTLATLFALPHLADWKTAAAEEGEDAQRQRSAQFRGLLASSS